VIDDQGNTRTDTHQILEDLVSGKAALTPLGGLGEDTAGEKEYLAWQDRKDLGVLVNSALQEQIIQMRNELGLKQYSFDFEGE
jgi:hypothetical protein